MQEDLNPWQILSEKTAYDNTWIKVTEFEVINPGGGRGIYGKVHFKHIAVGVIAIDEDWQTYLVGQYRFPLDAYSWEIPEGGGNQGVDPLESARRELLEETGLVATDWSVLLRLHLSNSVSDELAIVYLARGLRQETAMPEETEQLQVRKLPFEEAWTMLQEGKITDAISVAAIQQVKLLLLQGLLK